jgi:glycopeptide antibiotics resistance protein
VSNVSSYIFCLYFLVIYVFLLFLFMEFHHYFWHPKDLHTEVCETLFKRFPYGIITFLLDFPSDSGK